MWDKIVEYINTYGLKILIAIAVIFAGLIAIKIFISILKKILNKTKLEKATGKFLITVCKIGLWVLLFMGVFQYIGIPMTGFVAVVSAASLAMSLALQGSLSNLANGVVIISTKPFKEGDYVKIGNEEGTVTEIRMMHTVLKTVDNKEVSIPNQTVVASEIENFSRYKSRKLLMQFGVGYDTDISKIKDMLYNIMYNNNMVLLDPEPVVQLYQLNESSITIRIACWCATENYWDLYYEMMETVFNELKRENINIPFNQLEVRMREDIVTLPYTKTPVAKRSEDAVNSINENTEGEFVQYIKNTIRKTKKKSENNKKRKDKKKKNISDQNNNNNENK